MYLCGIYLKRGRIVITLVFVPVAILFCLTGTFFKSIGQNEQVSDQTFNYLISYLFGIYFMALADLQRKFLVQTDHSKEQMNVQVFLAFVHILWNYIFVIVLDLGVIGSGISSTITNILLFIGNWYYTNILDDLKEANRVSQFDKNVNNGLIDYLKIGIPSMVVMILDFLSQNIMTLLCGYIGIIE